MSLGSAGSVSLLELDQPIPRGLVAEQGGPHHYQTRSGIDDGFNPTGRHVSELRVVVGVGHPLVEDLGIGGTGTLLVLEEVDESDLTTRLGNRVGDPVDNSKDSLLVVHGLGLDDRVEYSWRVGRYHGVPIVDEHLLLRLGDDLGFPKGFVEDILLEHHTHGDVCSTTG